MNQQQIDLHAEALCDCVIIKAYARGRDVEKIVDDMKNVLSQTWDEESRAAIMEAVRKLETMGNEVTEYELVRIEQGLSNKLGKAFADKTTDALIQLQEAAYLMGAQEATAHTGIKFAWNLPDLKSLDVLDDNLRFWIGDYYKDDLQADIKAALKELFTGGYDRKKLIEAMIETLGDKFERAQAYWDLLADHTATKVREIGRVAGYEAANIRRVQFRAHIDDRTTAICRRMNGKIVTVSNMRGQVNKYLDACDTENKTKIKNAWKWWTDKQLENMSDKKLDKYIASGKIALPPLHARCRSITVAYFGD